MNKYFLSVLIILSIFNKAIGADNTALIESLSKKLPTGTYAGFARNGKPGLMIVSNKGNNYSIRIEVSGQSRTFELNASDEIRSNWIAKVPGLPVDTPTLFTVTTFRGQEITNNTTYGTSGWKKYNLEMEILEDGVNVRVSSQIAGSLGPGAGLNLTYTPQNLASITSAIETILTTLEKLDAKGKLETPKGQNARIGLSLHITVLRELFPDQAVSMEGKLSDRLAKYTKSPTEEATCSQKFSR